MIPADDPRLSPYEREIAAMRGDFRFKTDADALACCALGLVEEIDEARGAMLMADALPWGTCDAHRDDARACVLRELGDALWYATTALHRLDQNAMQAARCSNASTRWREDSLTDLQARGAEFAGLVKKALFHDRGIAFVQARSLWILGDCIVLVEACAHRYCATLGDVERANLDKIRKRFPSGGFTAAEANARADERGKAEQ